MNQKLQILDPQLDFEDWLKKKKACITGVDTRALTKKIRESGVA